VSRTARLGFTALASFVGVFTTFTATAEESTPTTARLEWTRAEGAEACIDGPALAEAVDRRWGRRVFVDDATSNVLVKGRVGRARGAWSVHLELERADGSKLGSRDIVTRAPDCSSLDDSVALALGLMLDLTEQSATSAETSRDGGAPPERPPITIPKETVAPRVPWWFETTLGGEAAVGLLPGLAFGGRLVVALEPPRLWRIELGGTLWQERDAESGPMGARLSMWTLDLAICPLTTEQKALNAWACLAQRAGTVRAEGVGFDRNASQKDTFLAAEARFGATWAFASPFVVHAAFGLQAPLVRLAFVYRDSQGDVGAVYRMSPVAGTFGLGIGARF
jgi:hypothetical protein